MGQADMISLLNVYNKQKVTRKSHLVFDGGEGRDATTVYETKLTIVFSETDSGADARVDL